jgi:xanthine dehydrogenase YagS FAD-binding subunit
MAVAMMALEATVHIRGAKGERSVPLDEFYFVPGSTPNRETVVVPGDLITFVTAVASEWHTFLLLEASRSQFL